MTLLAPPPPEELKSAPSPAAMLVPKACPAGQPGLLCLRAPHAYAPELLRALAPLLLRGGERALYCVDGANRFDPYPFALYARARGHPPEELLRRVFVTRAFTIHQLAAVVAEMLPALLHDEPRPAVILLGVEHLFLEESLRRRERQQVLESILRGLRALGDQGLALVMTYQAPPSVQAGWWRPLLHEAAHWNAALQGTPNTGLALEFS